MSHANPNNVYSSSATHWANDAYKDRLLSPEEHEIHGTGADVSRKAKTGLVFLQDTMKQFDLYMNIPGDYSIEGLCKVMLTEKERNLEYEHCMPGSNQPSGSGTRPINIHRSRQAMSFLEEVGTTVESLQCKLEQEDISQEQYNSAFRGLGEMVKSAIRVLDQLAPQPRPIGFQACLLYTSDAADE